MARNEVFLRAVEVLQSRRSLELIGEHRSGRTYLLRKTRDHFKGLGWQVIEIGGIESLRNTPLSALLVAGYLDEVDLRKPQLTGALKVMRELVQNKNTLITIDDGESIDEASWGIIDALSSQHGVPIISARLRHLPLSGLNKTSGGYRAMYSVEIPPMGYRELELALEQSLEVKFEPATMSRVFAKSGGNIGLAEAIVDSAMRRGTLRSVGGQLVAEGPLWTPELRALTEAILRTLDPEDLHALNTLSILGSSDIDTVRKVVPEERLFSLENRSFVSILRAEGRHMVTVRLPLVVEYFNYGSSHSRRAEILKRIDLAFTSTSDHHVSVMKSRDLATDIRLLHEMSRLRTVRANEAWHNEPNLQNAMNLLHAFQLDAFHSSHEVDTLLHSARGLSGSAELRAGWELAKATYVALHRGQLDEAIEMLKAASVAIPSEQAAFVARSFLLEVTSRNCPSEDPTSGFDWSRLSELSYSEVLTARTYWLLIRGRAFEAEEILATESAKGLIDPRLDVITVYTHIVQGRRETALRLAAELLHKAEAEFDASRIRVYAYLSAFTSFMSRRFTEVEKIISFAGALGLPSGESQQSYIGSMVLAAHAAAMRGQRTLTLQYLSILDAAGLTDGPLPGPQRGFVQMRLAFLDGDTAEAGAIGRTEGDKLWDRGALLAASYMYLSGMLLCPDTDNWRHIEPRLRQIDTAEARQLVEVLDAIVRRDIGGFLEALNNFSEWDERQVDYFTKHAIATFEIEGEFELAEQLRDATAGALTFEYPESRIELSPRENEVASLIATGLSNPMIAEALALSVRTVESHINRLMKKIGVRQRDEVRIFFMEQNRAI